MLINRVCTRSPADRGDVEVGDLLLAIDDEHVTGADDVGRLIAGKCGRRVELALVRGRQMILLTIELGRADAR